MTFADDGSRHIYFIQARALGLIKIGQTVNLADRLKQVRVNSADRVDLLGTILCMRGGLLEFELHARFHHLREHGEWHRPGPDLLAYIAEHAPTPYHSEEQYSELVLRPALRSTYPDPGIGQEPCAPVLAASPPSEPKPPAPDLPKGNSRKAILARYKAARGIT